MFKQRPRWFFEAIIFLLSKIKRMIKTSLQVVANKFIFSKNVLLSPFAHDGLSR